MKLQRIVKILWAGEVYETRTSLAIRISLDDLTRLKATKEYKDVDFMCKGITYGHGALDLLIKVFHGESIWWQAKTLKRLFRRMKYMGLHVKLGIMPYRWRDPKSRHTAWDHFTNREIR